MEKRKIPFGYGFSDGHYYVNREESLIVVDVFKQYLNNTSLSKIAEQLTIDKIEYLPGLSGWNKSRIKRMIEDVRYSGTEQYPQIVSPEIQQNAMNLLKYKRKTDKPTLTGMIKSIVPITRCACCGSRFERRTEPSKGIVKWYCTNRDCRAIIKSTDEDMENQVSELIDKVGKKDIKISNNEIETPAEIMRINNNIMRQIAMKGYNVDEIIGSALSLAAAKYRAVNDKEYISVYIKEKVQQANLSKAALLSDIAESVLFGNNGISVKLISGEIIRKEGQNGCSDRRKGGQGYTC